MRIILLAEFEGEIGRRQSIDYVTWCLAIPSIV